MRPRSFRLQIASAAAMAVALTVCSCAHADEPTDFYQGKSITLYVGYPPSGAYDLYARVIAPHMSRHMAGHPQFVVRHKPGAASLNLVNELYNVLPRDGSVIGMFARSIALNRLLGRDGASYDPVAFNWIGSANNEVAICGVGAGGGV